ncbi:hypothetical protein YC2023_074007 [Brassica napus]
MRTRRRTEEENHQEYKKGLWTVEEDNILRDYVLTHGKGQWNRIVRKTAKRVPGRTDNQVKNHWNTHLSKKIVGDYSSAVKTTGEENDPPSLLITAATTSGHHQQDKICDKSFEGLVSASYENKQKADLTHTNDSSLYFKERNNFDSSNAFWFNDDDDFEMNSFAMMDFASGDTGYCL